MAQLRLKLNVAPCHEGFHFRRLIMKEVDSIIDGYPDAVQELFDRTMELTRQVRNRHQPTDPPITNSRMLHPSTEQATNSHRKRKFGESEISKDDRTVRHPLVHTQAAIDAAIHQDTASSPGKASEGDSEEDDDDHTTEGTDGYYKKLRLQREREETGIEEELHKTPDNPFINSGIKPKRIPPDILAGINEVYLAIEARGIVEDRTKTLELIGLFGRAIGADGFQSLVGMIELLRFHKQEHGHRPTESLLESTTPTNLVEAAVKAYRSHDAYSLSAIIDSCMRNIRMAELSRHVDALEAEARDRTSLIRREFDKHGFSFNCKRLSTVVIDYILWKVDGVHPGNVRDSAEKRKFARKRRKRLHSMLGHGRLFSRLWDHFGVGVFGLLPDSKYTTFRGWKASEVEAVAQVMAEKFPQISLLCRCVEENIIKPLVWEGKDGVDIIAQLEMDAKASAREELFWDGKRMRALLPSSKESVLA